MNGRLIYAFLGFSLILLGMLRQQQAHGSTLGALGLQALGVGACAVSSGTVIGAFLAVCLFQALLVMTTPRQYRVRKNAVCIVLLIALGVIVPNLLQLIVKSLSYYKYDFSRLLLHGMFCQLYFSESYSLSKVLTIAGAYLVCITVAFTYIGYRWHAHYPALLPLCVILYVICASGIVAYSVLFCILPIICAALTALLLHVALQKRIFTPIA